MTQTYINIGGSVRAASSFTLPTDRLFRGAWQFSGSAVEVDMSTAREIHKDALRLERKPLLEALDVEWLLAAETSDTNAQATVVTQKQALRAVTDDARIAAAATPSELKALTLDALLT